MIETVSSDVFSHRLFSDLSKHIVEEFKSYHLKNPKVFEMFHNLSVKVRQRGFKHYAADAIIQQIRWHYEIEDLFPVDVFKVNNNYPACYSRLLMATDSSFVGFFRTRHTPGTIQTNQVNLEEN